MKKIYSKPEIVFESFVVNTNIASCGIDTDLPSKGSCGISFVPGQVLFLSSSTGCNVYVEEGSTDNGNNGTCYHNPSATTMLFGS